MKHGKFSESVMPLVHGKWSEKSFAARQLDPAQVRAVRAALDEAAKSYSKKGKKDTGAGHLAATLQRGVYAAR